MRLNYVVVGLIMVLLVATVAGCSREQESPQITETLARVTKGDITVPVQSAGTLTLKNKTDLKFGVAGDVIEVNVSEGEVVSQGTVLAQIDVSSLQATVEEFESRLATAEKALEDLVAPPSELDLSLAEADVTHAEKVLDNAETEKGIVTAQQSREVENSEDQFDGLRDDYFYLFRKYYGIRVEQSDQQSSRTLNWVSSELDPSVILNNYPVDQEVLDYQQTLTPERAYSQNTVLEELTTRWEALKNASLTLWVTQLNQSKANANADRSINQARSALKGAEENLMSLKDGPDREAIQRKKADITGFTESLRQAKADLGKASLIAPWNGVITTVSIEKGDRVGANTSIVNMVDPNDIEVQGRVDELDVLKIKEGQTVRISPTAFPQAQIPGTVERISLLPVSSQGTVNYGISIAISRIPERAVLREGMTVTVTIITSEVSDVLLVPVGAVRRESGSTVVEVESQDGSREVRTVDLGLSDGENIEVKRGLARDEQVVVRQGAPTQSNFLRRSSRGLVPPGGGGGR